MNRRNVLINTGASMIASQLPARPRVHGTGPTGAGRQVMADWIADGRVQGASSW